MLLQKNSLRDFFSRQKQLHFFDLYETGKITSHEFREECKKTFFLESISDEQFDNAWSSMLLEMPIERFNFLKKISKEKNIFLLSNINEIHENFINDYLKLKFGNKEEFYSLFDGIYFSHHIGLRKPEIEIFKYLLSEAQCDYSRTCFFDDSEQHIKAALDLGINAFLVPANSLIVEN